MKDPMKTLAMAMTPTRANDVCDPETRRHLQERYTVRWASENLNSGELRQLLQGSDVVITSWGTPHISADMLAGSNSPKVIAHAAGSVKSLIDPSAFDLGVTVFSAAARIAASVGEYCLAAALTSLRRLPEFDATMRVGQWKPAQLRGRELTGQTVGIVGASSTARAFIALLAPFHCDIVIYDPYLSPERAAELGARCGTLEEVVRCAVISIHVPDLPETEGMITARLIAAMPDGAVVINSSRGPAVDYEALAAAITAGRIQAALDVFPQEPPTLSQALKSAPQVLLSSHIAGDTVEGHLALVKYVLDDVEAWLERGELGRSHVNPATLALSA